MSLTSLAELVGLPCRVRGQRVGEVTSVIVDAEVTRVLGLDVRAVDGRRLFLPWVAVELHDDGVEVRSTYLLVDAGDSYTSRGARGVSDVGELGALRVRGDGQIAHDVVVSIRARTGTHHR